MSAQRSPATEQLGGAVDALARLLASRRVAGRFAEAVGADLGQQGIAVVRALGRHGRQPIATLAGLAQMDVAAVSRQLRTLEAAGLVERRVDADDRRVTLVALTAAGRGVARRIQTAQRRHFDEALAEWSEDEKHRLATLLTRFVADLRSTPIR